MSAGPGLTDGMRKGSGGGIRNSRAVYENVDYPRIDVTDMTVEETAEEILKIIGTGNEEETGNAVMGSMG